MDESRAVLDRLDRIEALDRAGASARTLVPELQALLEEATAWSRAEGGDAAARAVEDLRSALASAQDRDVQPHVSAAQMP